MDIELLVKNVIFKELENVKVNEIAEEVIKEYLKGLNKDSIEYYHRKLEKAYKDFKEASSEAEVNEVSNQIKEIKEAISEIQLKNFHL